MSFIDLKLALNDNDLSLIINNLRNPYKNMSSETYEYMRDSFIKNYAEQYGLEAVVVGEPKGLNNQKTDASEFVDQFITRLSRSIKGIKIIREDERFTSKIAAQSLLESGLKKSKRQEKGNLDKVSAAIILQSYLDKLSRT